MAGGTNRLKGSGFTPDGGSWEPPQWGQGGYPGGKPGGPPPNPAQMEAWKRQFSNSNPGQQGIQHPAMNRQLPPMNIPGLLPRGQPGQYGSRMPPGFPGYDNLPENWQDEGYTWQDPNNPNAKYNIIA